MQSLEKFEATPLVVDGVMYTVQAPNDVVALDAATGRVFWIYPYAPSTLARLCCGRVNRGLAMLGDTLFMGTIDGHLIAIDAKTGGLVWNVAVGGARPEAGYGFTVAPLVVKDKVIVGSAGGEYGIRGFLAAFDAKTGKEAWRFNTIPGPGETRSRNLGGRFLEERRRLRLGHRLVRSRSEPDYWGIGNPGPDWNGDGRAGDNLYSESVVALDADTGQMKWHFQFTPHDEFDYDAVQVPVLADIDWQGRPRKVMMWANRNGFLYVLDRDHRRVPARQAVREGELDRAASTRRAVRRTCSRSDRRRHAHLSGQPGRDELVFAVVQPAHRALLHPDLDGQLLDLHQAPGRVHRRPALHRRAAGHRCACCSRGRSSTAGCRKKATAPIQAIDPKTGEQKWEFKMTDVTDSGV